MYKIEITRKAQKSLAKLKKKQRDKIVQSIFDLANDPCSKAKKLKGREGYRIRVGDYRVIYEIENDKIVVIVLHIGHRREIYEKTH